MSYPAISLLERSARKVKTYPSSHVQVPVFWICQTFLNFFPGLTFEPSGRFSATNMASLQPTFVVELDAVVGAANVGRAVMPVNGVLLNEMVGSAPDVVGEAAPAIVGRAKVGRSTGALVGAGVDVGWAAAVCVNWMESWAIVVPTSAVLTAFTSTVGAGVAPTLQLARIKAVMAKKKTTFRMCFRTNISFTSVRVRSKVDWKYPF